jgi:hypothetical protein
LKVLKERGRRMRARSMGGKSVVKTKLSSTNDYIFQHTLAIAHLWQECKTEGTNGVFTRPP